jgi:nitroimidazol reductase NimA-like FMN-containing flavoprotein (pyridoxamine 5'-phosphate oxidase superfamily)
MAEYAKTSINTVHRHREQGIYDYATVHSIVNQTSILHVSFLPVSPEQDSFPVTLPMLGTMASFLNPSSAVESGEEMDLYLHGHAASRFMKLPSTDTSHAEGVPVCVAATIFDGIVLALTPFNHSCNYRSAILHGYATLVTDEAEKSFALHRITDNLVGKRWANSRVPPTKAEMTSTGVLKVSIISASAKIRTGGPGDDRKDLKDEDVTGRVWTGVVPVYERFGDLVPGDNNRVPKVPGYLEEWREEKNKAGETYAVEVAKSKKTK